MDDRGRDDDLPPDQPHGRDEPSAPGDTPRATPVTQQLGRAVVVVVLVVFIVFAVSNSQSVDFSWVVGSTEVVEDPTTGETSGGVPLIVLLLSAFVVGALSGAMAVRIARRRRAKAADEER